MNATLTVTTAKPRKPRLTAAEKRARDWEAAAPARAAREAERIATREAQLVRDEERKAVEKRQAMSRNSPRMCHLTAADAIRDGLASLDADHDWQDVLQPVEKFLGTLTEGHKPYLRLETALMEAQDALEKRVQQLDDLLSEAQRLLGDRP